MRRHSSGRNSSSSTSSSSPRPEARRWKSLAGWAMTRSSTSTSESSTPDFAFLKTKSVHDVESRPRPEPPSTGQPLPRRDFWGRGRIREEFEPQNENAERNRRPEATFSSQASPPRKIIRARSDHEARHSDHRNALIPPHSPHSSPDRTPQEMPRWTVQQTPQQAPQRLPQHAPHRTPPQAPRREDTAQLHSAPKSGADSPGRRSTVDQEHKVSSLQRTATPRKAVQKTPIYEKAGPQSSREGAPKAKESRRGRRLWTPVGTLRKKGAPKTPKGRRHVGYHVLREIYRYQHSTQPLIPRLAFARVVREVLWQVADTDYRMQKLALQALQETAEAVVVALLEGSNTLAHHARRATIMQRDLACLMALIRSHGSLQRCLE